MIKLFKKNLKTASPSTLFYKCPFCIHAKNGIDTCLFKKECLSNSDAPCFGSII